MRHLTGHGHGSSNMLAGLPPPFGFQLALRPPELADSTILLLLQIVGQSLAVPGELSQVLALHTELLPESRQGLLDNRRVLMTPIQSTRVAGTTLDRMMVPRASLHSTRIPRTSLGCTGVAGTNWLVRRMDCPRVAGTPLACT